MNRRSFLKSLGLVIGGVALEQAVPLGRVYSFPSNIVASTADECIALQLEMVSGALPLSFAGIPVYEDDTVATDGFYFIDRRYLPSTAQPVRRHQYAGADHA